MCRHRLHKASKSSITRCAAITIAATTNGTPWTASGFNSTFIKAIAQATNQGLVGDGLTFHGLRHTVGTLLIEAGADIDTVRRWLGQKTLGDGDPLFGDGRHVGQDAGNNEGARPARDQTPNKSV